MYNRWYDKYSELKMLLTLLEKVNEYDMELIAQDFLQIILDKYKYEFDNKMQSINQNQPLKYNRWYDNNYTLQTCIEFLKTLSDNEKQELINSFIMSVMSFINNVDEK